jgi:hypothetical protein
MNKLYLVCPFSKSEGKIRESEKGKLFFYTALGADFNFSDFSFVEKLIDFIDDNEIQAIYFVHDSESKFLNDVITMKSPCDTRVEYNLVNLYIDQFDWINNMTTTDKKVEALAYLHINSQLEDFKSHYLINQAILQYNIKVAPLIIKEKNISTFSNFNSQAEAI